VIRSRTVSRTISRTVQRVGVLGLLALAATAGGVACKRDVWPGPTPEAASPQAQAPQAAEPVDLATAPIPAGGHPRILLTDGRLKMLADGAKRGTPSWNALVSACREASGEKIESGYQGEDWSAASLNLALCWRVRHDTTYARAAVTYLMALVDDHEKVGDGEGGVAAVKLDDGYPMRHRGFFASIAYDWLYDALTPEQRKHVADRFVEFVHWYAKDGYKTNDPISNYFLSYFGACAMGGIALEGDDPRGAELRQLALRMWKTQIVPGYAKLPGGDFPEGWQYARVPVESLAFFVESEGRLRGSAAQLARDLPWLGATVDFQNAALQPDGVHTWDNADWSNKPARLAPEMSWAASLALPKDDPRGDEAVFLARLLTKGGAESPRWLAAIADDPARKGVDPRKGATSYVAHGTGTVFARTGWDAGAVWAAMNSGPPWGDHQHLDQGHFELVRGADRIVTDPGAYDSYSTMSHNSILVDDNHENLRWSPNQGVWGKQASLPRSEDSGAVVYAEADFGAAYDPADYPEDHPERSVVRAQREMVFSRAALTGAHGASARMVLYDRVTLTKPKYGVTWTMHTPVAPTATAAASVATASVGASSLVVTTLSPVARSARLTEPTVHKDDMFNQNDVADGLTSVRTEEESPRGAVERRFLHVLAVGARGDALPAATRVDGEGAEGAALDGEAYVFPIDRPQKAPSPLKWRAPVGASKHVVTGLAPGGHYDASAAREGELCRVTLDAKAAGAQTASAAGTLTLDLHDCAVH
jgi:hypothetical protein